MRSSLSKRYAFFPNLIVKYKAYACSQKCLLFIDLSLVEDHIDLLSNYKVNKKWHHWLFAFLETKAFHCISFSFYFLKGIYPKYLSRYCGHFPYIWKLLPYFLNWCYCKGLEILTTWQDNMFFSLGNQSHTNFCSVNSPPSLITYEGALIYMIFISLHDEIIVYCHFLIRAL